MLEPRVTQLLVALAEAKGAVVSRERLIERCWGAVVVGDDSLNRAIAGLRRGLKDAGSRAVEVITVPKVGYRLSVREGEEAQAASTPAWSQGTEPRAAPGTSRRLMLGAAAALAAGTAIGGGAWLMRRGKDRSRTEAELARAGNLLGLDRYGTEGEARAMLERVVTADPEEARGWGLLAVAWQRIAATSIADTLAEAERQAREAGRRALALDRLQGDAQAALAMLEPMFGAWMATEQRLERALEVAPENVFAQLGLMNVLSANGRFREARKLAREAAARHPKNELVQASAIQLAWAEEGADQALRLDGATSLPGLRVGLAPWLLAEAGRHEEAERLIAGVEAKQRVPSRVLTAQRLTARALGTGSAVDVAAARDALLPLGALGGRANVMAIGGLSGLGLLDDAFAVAERWYLNALAGGDSAAARATRHLISTRILFLPITSAMRADDRFVPLCQRIGLVAYWQQRGLRADALKDRLLPP